MKKCRDLIKPRNHTENIAAIINNMPKNMSEQKYFHAFMFSHLQKQILITGQISRAYVLFASSHYYSLIKYNSKNFNYL